MKVSVNWLKEYTDINLSVDELVTKIGAQLGAVEEVIDIGQKYQGIIVAKVVSCAKHPNADKLKVCQIDTGKDKVQVVCGAPNVREGMLVAWLPPGSTVPATYSKDPFVLEARELRGEMSNGMLASAQELAIGDDHSGILELSEGKPGDDFAKIYGLDDYIIDIENKMFTHRPDLFGILGIAREIAGIQQKPFKSPDWYEPTPKFPDIEAEELKLEVRNEIPDLVPRFVAITMRGVELGPSPLWLQIKLAKVGIKSINNIVDYSNYFMLESAQPIHIYDYDKVKVLSSSDSAKMVIRYAKPGETITTLSGKTIKPSSKTMMVATDQKLICVGGAIGGAETEVDSNTKNIIIEAANWDMFQSRRTSMEYGIFTDAVTRLSKGQSPLQNLAVVARIVNEIRQHTSGTVASNVIDEGNLLGERWDDVRLSKSFINQRLGLNLTEDQIAGLLTNVEFNVQIKDDELVVSPPFWRMDIQIPEDVVEEVGRLYGYDHLPLDLPKRSLVPVDPDKLLMLKKQLRMQLAKLGANEVLTYSFVHGNLLDKVGQDKNQAFKIANALSPDLQYYRLSLAPSLLDKVHMNIKAGHNQFALFEIGKVHGKAQLDKDGLPREFERLAFVYADKNNSPEAAYYQARAYLSQLTQHSIIPFNKNLLKDYPMMLQMTAPYDEARSALVWNDEMVVGVVGEFKSSVSAKLKLPTRTAGFELFLTPLLTQQPVAYTPLSRYPSIAQDISLKTNTNVPFADIASGLSDALLAHVQDDVEVTTACLDIFSSGVSTKHTTFRVTAHSHERTLTTELVNNLLDKAATNLSSTLGAVRI